MVVEAGILGLAGALLGVVLGLGSGHVVVVLAGGRVDVATGVPWQVVGLTVVLGVSVRRCSPPPIRPTWRRGCRSSRLSSSTERMLDSVRWVTER